MKDTELAIVTCKFLLSLRKGWNERLDEARQKAYLAKKIRKFVSKATLDDLALTIHYFNTNTMQE